MRASGIVWLCFALTLTAARAEDSQWTRRDYVDFYFRHYNGHVPLPHLRNAAQKALFSHLVDPGNITRIEESPASDDEKLRQLRIILAILGSYRAAYNVAVIVGEPLQQELTLVQVHSLEVAAAVARLVRLSRADEGSSTAWATLVEGVIESVGDSERYSSSQRTAMADAVTLHYPAISAVLSGDERHHLDEALKRMKQALPAAP
ncbi:MAG: hypothetical protein H7X89_10025 [Rhizobiales bacterium]|nr:hypothetical protein [Hyphomicrobiales bacterium]